MFKNLFLCGVLACAGASASLITRSGSDASVSSQCSLPGAIIDSDSVITDIQIMPDIFDAEFFHEDGQVMRLHFEVIGDKRCDLETSSLVFINQHWKSVSLWVNEQDGWMKKCIFRFDTDKQPKANWDNLPVSIDYVKRVIIKYHTSILKRKSIRPKVKDMKRWRKTFCKLRGDVIIMQYIQLLMLYRQAQLVPSMAPPQLLISAQMLDEDTLATLQSVREVELSLKRMK